MHKLTISSFLVLMGFIPVFAADWPHWRGPTRNGHTEELSGWNGTKWLLTNAWKGNFGEGNSAPLEVGGKLFQMGWKGGKDFLYCVDSRNGMILWEQSYKAPRYGRNASGDQVFFSGPSSTPDYDSKTGYLYTLSCDGDLCCWETKNQGKLLWNKNLHESYKVLVRPKVGRSGQRDYGYTSSPLVLQDRLIVEVGAKEGTLIAFDLTTGKELWRSTANEPAGHNGGPVPITVGNESAIATLTHKGVLVVAASGNNAGKTIATWPWETNFSNNIASVTVDKDHLIATSHYNILRTMSLKITARGAEKIWEAPVASKVCSPVIHGEKMYFAWSKLHCLDLRTGKRIWEEQGYHDQGSCVVTKDNKLIIYSGKGQLTLVDLAGDAAKKCTVLANRPALFQNDAWPHVVLSNKKLFCRDRMGNLAAFHVGE
ncbi:MAG: PQQ-binding-like beta-propeller repeat protein [Zavarzinella sp.]